MKDLKSLGLRRIGGNLALLDQTKLPGQESWRTIENVEAMIDAIQRLQVRGAPLIGVAAGLALAHAGLRETKPETLLLQAENLRAARPTAVNLMAAIDRLRPLIGKPPAALMAAAEAIFDEDVALCESMANHGATLIEDGDGILTHCNTGGLATAGVGTALGVIRRAYEVGKKIHVYVDETRPLLQGGRLTTWELSRLGIPHTLICDHMGASLMKRGLIRRVFLGADRIAKNGDVANKIGTYNVAVIARHHGVPFYVVAPSTTLDRHCPGGEAIPIEERAAEEVLGSLSFGAHPPNVWNPAFDVTPAALIQGIVTDRGIFKPQQLWG